MADTTYYRFVLKRDTAANFTAKNTLLLAGEFGLETDTGKLKLSLDGTTYWNSLAYYGAGTGTGGVNQQTGTSYTFATSDVEQTVICSNAAAVAVTIPTNATAPIAIGAKIAYTQGGAGQLTITGASGVTVHAPNGNTTGAAYDGGVAEKIGTDEWQLWNGPALGPLASAADAPNDGMPYSRQNGAWAAATGGSSGGGITAMNEQTGDYTLVAGDATKAIRATKSTGVSITIPAGVLPVLCTVPLFQGGAGAATFVAGSGVTFESPNGAATAAVGDFRVAFQRATNVWVIG